MTVFDRYHIKIHSENIVVARKVFTLLKKSFNIRTDISVKRNVKRESVSYLVVIKSHEDALRVLQATKMIGEQQVGTDAICGFNPLIIRQVCCRRAFLRGVFQAAGSMSDPNKSYHFEIVCTIFGDCRADQVGLYAVLVLTLRLYAEKSLMLFI